MGVIHMNTNKRLRLFYYFFRITIGLLLIASIVGIIIDVDGTDVSRNIFVALQASVLLLLSLGPSYAEKKFKIEIPDFLESIFLVFIIAALFLGEVADFFVNISWWDDMLHTISGILVAIVGFSIINSAVKNPKTKIVINPFVIALFVFCFSMTVEIIWELIEYTFDTFSASSNMLRTRNSITLVPFEGLEAIRDTMHDIILNVIASLTISVIGYFDAKNNYGLFKKWLIYSVRESNN
jgi:hypothetical protein